MVGKDNVAAALDEGRGVVLALPHSGNWDIAGVWLAQEQGTFTTVAERLKPESLFWRFIGYRESLGFEVLPLSGGQRPAYEVLVERLRANRVVCSDGRPRSHAQRRAGRPSSASPRACPPGPARLAVETGAQLLPTLPLVRRRTAGAWSSTHRWTRRRVT